MSLLDVRTHEKISHSLCGAPVSLGEGTASVSMHLSKEMVVDEKGLVHGGFVFGLADHAAMLAVNDPNVVLGAAETRFLAPCVPGDELVAEASSEGEGKKRTVRVVVRRGEKAVMEGTFTCFVLAQHVLDRGEA